MMHQSKHPQMSLFEADEPRVVLAAAQETELATLVKVLLLEIATALSNREICNDQDHL